MLTDDLTVVATAAIGVLGAANKQVNTGTGRSGDAAICLGPVVANVKF